MIRNPTNLCCLIVVIFLFRAGVIFGQSPVPLKVSDPFLPVNAAEVKVGGEIGRRIDITEHANLESLHLDKYFIQPFQQKKRKDGFVGTGMLIDAVAKLAAHSQDPGTIKIKNMLVEKIIAAQEPDGYIGMFPKAERMWILWDVHEMSYVIYGLLTDYQLFKNEKALDAAIRSADYLITNWSSMPPKWEEKTTVNLEEATTGIDRAMVTIYRLTGRQKYLDFSIRQKGLRDWNQPIEIGRQLGLHGHIYGFLSMSLAQLELYRLSADPRLLQQSRRAIDFMTTKDGAVISGAAGQWETWTDDQDGENALGETCASAYQIRVYENLFRLSGDARYGDLIERTLYNTLFAAQSPKGDQIRYYTPMVGARRYFHEQGYCCPNNYRRIIAELPSMIWYKGAAGDGEGIGVNLYTPSSTKLSLAKAGFVELEQLTDYPNTGTVTIRISPAKPAVFLFSLRIPEWCKMATITINGAPWKGKVVPGSMAKINRKWSKGDVIKMEMPMETRVVKGRKRQAGRVAVMRGPVLFCLNPERNPGVDHVNKEVDPDNKLNAFDLGRIILDPLTIGAPEKDETVRPGGLSLTVKGWKEGWTMGRGSGPHDVTLTLTEFADPGGKTTYFRLANLSESVDDELFK